MATMASPGGGVSKVTPQASIIINTSAESFDRALRRDGSNKNTLYNNTSNEDDFCIARGELCFAQKKKTQSTQVYGQNNPSVQVFTSANGLMIPANMPGINANQSVFTLNELEKDMIKRALAKSLWFVGVAQGDKMRRDFDNRSLALAVRVAGSDTVFNSGTDTFYPGDTVVWDMPHYTGGPHVRYGEPKTKNIFVVSKYEYNESRLKEDLKDINAAQQTAPAGSDAKLLYNVIEAMVNSIQNNGRTALANIMNGTDSAFLTAFTRLNVHKQETYDRRIIGKALSEGKPGMHFDILLHHHHKIS